MVGSHEINEIANANSRQNISKLIQGWSRYQEACPCPLQVQLDPLILQFRPPLVLLKLTCVHCVGLACRKNDEARSKGRHTGFGCRKGTKDAKTSQKTRQTPIGRGLRRLARGGRTGRPKRSRTCLRCEIWTNYPPPSELCTRINVYLLQ